MSRHRSRPAHGQTYSDARAENAGVTAGSSTAPCSTCGTIGCTDDNPTCIVCTAKHARLITCKGCRAQLMRDLTGLPDAYVHLFMALEPGSAVGEKVTRSRSAPLPLREDIDERMTDVVAALSNWARTAQELAGATSHPRPDNRRPRDSILVSTAVRLLIRHADRLLRSDDHAKRFVTELHTLAGDVRRQLGQTRGKDRLREPCPACQLKTLVHWHGADQVECEACGQSWPEDQYQLFVRVLEQEAAGRRGGARR